MKIFRADQVREADAYTIENEPISSIDLMERAAEELCKKLTEIYDREKRFAVFCGPGNNGGDGLALARLLSEKNFNVKVFIVKFSDKTSPDFDQNLKRLKSRNKVSILEIFTTSDSPEIKANTIIVDAIFGSGLTRPAEGLARDIILKINASECEKVAVDIPSGLFGEENPTENKNVIEAKHTFTFESPFLSFFFPQNAQFVGEIHVLSIGIHPEYKRKTQTPFHFIKKEDILPILKKRDKFSHKGTYGHALIFAGNYGKAGAGILCAKAAHRAGAGLVSAAVPKCNREILQIATPETMLQIDTQKKWLTRLPDLRNYNSIAIGPGIGFHPKTQELLFDLIETAQIPIIFDADAITILSQKPEYLSKIPKKSIFTPHPKEFERLVGKSENNYKRLQKQIAFAKQYKCIVILKGAHTATVLPNGNVYFNSTGSPGMATGGSGDVLTGILAGLIAQNYSPEEAAVLAVYLHGLAGDLAAEENSETALISSDIICYISKAFLNSQKKSNHLTCKIKLR